MTQEEIKRRFPETFFPNFSEKEINKKIKEVKCITANIDNKTIIIPMSEEKAILENNRLLKMYSIYLLHSDRYETKLHEVKAGDILYCFSSNYSNNKFFKIDSFIDREKEFKELMSSFTYEVRQYYYNNVHELNRVLKVRINSKENQENYIKFKNIEITSFNIHDVPGIFIIQRKEMLKLEKIIYFFAEIRLFAEKNNIFI